MRQEARTEQTSLNELCARKLAPPGSVRSGPTGAAVTRAAVVVGDALVGVVAFGSWARQEMRDQSDVDGVVLFERDLRVSGRLVEFRREIASARVSRRRIHDVSAIMLSEHDRLPEAVEQNLATLTEISRNLRRDRELAFYGAEDLTPSGFYSGGASRRIGVAKRPVQHMSLTAYAVGSIFAGDVKEEQRRWIWWSYGDPWS